MFWMSISIVTWVQERGRSAYQSFVIIRRDTGRVEPNNALRAPARFVFLRGIRVRLSFSFLLFPYLAPPHRRSQPRLDQVKASLRSTSCLLDYLLFLSCHLITSPAWPSCASYTSILSSPCYHHLNANTINMAAHYATPAPSSDPDFMLDSSPRKGHAGKPVISSPFDPIDLNARVVHSFAARKGLATPVSSSPTKPERPIVTLGRSAPHADLKRDESDAHAGLKLGSYGEPNILMGSYTHTLVIGRSKPSGQPHASFRGGSEEKDAESELGAHELAALPSSGGLGARRAMRVALPNTARHVSRLHAVVEYSPFAPRPAVTSFAARGMDQAFKACSGQEAGTGSFVVRIVGQNGLILDGKRRREGQVFRLIPGKSVLDFFGVEAHFEAPPPPASQQPSPFGDVAAARTVQNGVSPIKARIEARPTQMLRAYRSDARFEGKTKNHQNSSARLATPPPTSSPRRLSSSPVRRDLIHRLSEDDDEDSEGREQSAILSSPTLGRKRRVESTVISRKRPLALASESQSDEDSESASSEEEGHSAPEMGQNKSRSKKRSHAALQDDEYSEAGSGSESDLTPTPSPVKSTPRNRARSNSARPRSRPASRASSLAPNTTRLSESQIRMPPPAPPAVSSGLIPNSASEFARARRLVRLLARTYDLPGLLAGAIVFHRTATISASEAVRSVLAGTPGLLRGEAGAQSAAFSPRKGRMVVSPSHSSASQGTNEEKDVPVLNHGAVVDGWGAGDRWNVLARRAWREAMEETLGDAPMFGVIQRAGKDASGSREYLISRSQISGF